MQETTPDDLDVTEAYLLDQEGLGLFDETLGQSERANWRWAPTFAREAQFSAPLDALINQRTGKRFRDWIPPAPPPKRVVRDPPPQRFPGAAYVDPYGYAVFDDTIPSPEDIQKEIYTKAREARKVGTKPQKKPFEGSGTKDDKGKGKEKERESEVGTKKGFDFGMGEKEIVRPIEPPSAAIQYRGKLMGEGESTKGKGTLVPGVVLKGATGQKFLPGDLPVPRVPGVLKTGQKGDIITSKGHTKKGFPIK